MGLRGKGRFRRSLPALLFLGLTGCVATQRDMLDLNQQTDEIKAQVAELKRSIAGLQANQADLALKMDQVRSDLSVFTENLKDSQDRMTRLGSKLDDVEVALGQKVLALGESLTKQQREQLATQKASQQAAEQAAREAAGAAEAAAKKAAEQAATQAAEQTLEKQRQQAPPPGSPTPSVVFHTAQMNLSRKSYDLAAQGFETYLKLFPKGEMADLAMFYLGEARFGAKSWVEAAKQYAQVLDRFPKSDVTAAARLKYAMALLNMKEAGYTAEAKRYLQSIQDDFPKSPEAGAASKLLNKLEPAPAKGRKG